MARRHILIGLGLHKLNFRSRGLARMLKGKGSMKIVSPYGRIGVSVPSVPLGLPSTKSIKPLSFRY